MNGYLFSAADSIHVLSPGGSAAVCRTIYLIDLPLTEEVVNPDHGKGRKASPRGAETLLVVEDQAEVLRISLQSLKDAGIPCTDAVDSEAAFAGLRANATGVGLLVTDVAMPGNNGREPFERVKDVYPPLKVLSLSGYPAEVISTHAVPDEGVHFLRNPFPVQDLPLHAREVLDCAETGSR